MRLDQEQRDAVLRGHHSAFATDLLEKTTLISEPSRHCWVDEKYGYTTVRERCAIRHSALLLASI